MWRGSMAKSSSAGLSALGARVWNWCDERLALSSIWAIAEKKTVPLHRHTFWYFWGGISLLLFIVQAITGVLLLIYYRPGPEAYDSVRSITYDIQFGWFVRSLHSWAANLMVFAVFVHMFSVAFMKAYRRPREFGWWTGLALMGLVLVFGFSGYLLPWDELSYFATAVGLEIPRSLPGVGALIANIVQGGPEVSTVTVQRFFALHVFVLPLVFMGILGVHLALIMKHGSAVPPSEEARPERERRSIPFFPNFATQDLVMWLICFNVLCVMAFVFPWQLGKPADPLASAPEGIHPEWYFMSQFQVLKVLGEWIPGYLGEILGIGLFTLGGVLWGLLPLYDNTSQSGVRARHATWLALIALIGLLALTIWGYAGL
jgi:quinol-cytochrome oxidoreductase complex cytochrome b subunit